MDSAENDRIMFRDNENKLWIEENANYSAGKGNIFLMRGLPGGLECIGGVDFCHRRRNWSASIRTHVDDEGSDTREVFLGGRGQAIEELWSHRLDAV